MGEAKEDLGAVLAKLESWGTAIPPQAAAFHGQRTDLIKRIRALAGLFQRKDPKQVEDILARSRELEKALPDLERLFQTIQEARSAVSEFLGLSAAAQDLRVHGAVADAADDWQKTLDAIEAQVGPQQVEPLVNQVAIIERWARRRRSALQLLIDASALRPQVTEPKARGELESLINGWRGDFCWSRTDTAWEEQVRTAVDRFRKPVPPAEPQPELPPPHVEPKKPEAAKPEPPKPEPPKPEPPPNAALQLREIGLALADCRDMSDVLEWSGRELDTFTAQLRQLRDAPDAAGLEKLNSEIRTFQTSLRDQAARQHQARLDRLRRRSRYLAEIYGARDDIRALAEQAAAVNSGDAAGLRQLSEIADTAEQRIYAVANNDRSRLSGCVRQAIEGCRNLIASIAQQCRSRAANAALAEIHGRLPADLPGQVDARQSFERLERCEDLFHDLHALDEENQKQQGEVLARAGRVQRVAAELAADDPEVAATLPPVPALGPEHFLEEIAGELDRIEQRLETRRKQVIDDKAAELARLRAGNRGWIRLLADFSPEAESLVTGDPAPSELAPLRDLVHLEARNQRRLGELVTDAAMQLRRRIDTQLARIRELLERPAFETHPDYSAATELLGYLESLPPLGNQPEREDFDAVLNASRDFEAFMDRIDHARRAVPERAAQLEERFRVLRDRNGHAYRPELSQRVNLLIQGIRYAMALNEWDRLAFQLDETDRLLAAIENDAARRIAVEVEEAVAALEAALRTCNDAQYARQIQSAVEQVESAGELQTPPFHLRRRLALLLGRRGGARSAR